MCEGVSGEGSKIKGYVAFVQVKRCIRKKEWINFNDYHVVHTNTPSVRFTWPGKPARLLTTCESPECQFMSIDSLHTFIKAEELAWKGSPIALEWHREIRNARAKINRERRWALSPRFLSIMAKLAVQIENAAKAVMCCPNTHSLTHNA